MLTLPFDDIIHKAIFSNSAMIVPVVESIHRNFLEQFKISFLMHAQIHESYPPEEMEELREGLNDGDYDHYFPDVKALSFAMQNLKVFHMHKSKSYCAPVKKVW